MGDGKAAVKCAGAIAWAAFEMPKGMPTRYRAGIDWGVTPEGPNVESFAKKHKKETSRLTSDCVSQLATTLSSRTIVSLRSEPVEINPTGTPLTSSSRLM